MDSIDQQYNEILDRLYSRLPMFSRIGAAAYKPGLQTTETLDEIYDHPHRKFRTIHIAGTNGKGSTSHLLASALQANGLKTGLYTSPHLTDFRERMRINGEMIPKLKVIEFVEDWESRSSRYPSLSPSFFELTMMMAFDWFAKENVDIAVIETGMGGRLDSTNIITPELCVITNISYDHTQFLGNTLEAIAAEKAGIIKRGVPVVIGEAEGEVMRVFQDKAAEVGAPIYFASPLAAGVVSLEAGENGWECHTVQVGIVKIPLAGSYQRHNILTTLTALRVLDTYGIEKLDPQSVKEGLENVTTNTGLRGRWQVIGDTPTVICDTGHNLAGLRENVGKLKKDYPDRTIRFVVGFVNDKDVAHIVELFPKDGIYYFTRASVPRSMDAEELSRHFQEAGISGSVIPSVEMAYRTAMEDASSRDIIYVGGSTFVVADLLRALEK